MSDETIHMVKKKSSNRMKRNHASKIAEIEFLYKKDAKIVHFHGKFATSSESAWAKRELYTVQLTYFLQKPCGKSSFWKTAYP